MNCKICENSMTVLFTQEVLKKYPVQYFRCTSCDYICTEEPHWLSEAYSRPINLSDTGLIGRNIDTSNIVSIMLYLLFRKDARFLDYAGGYGLFTRLMRDIGYNFYWSDPYTQNLFANGFEDDNETEYEAVTAFEVFEHLANPIEEIKKMSALSSSIIFSTEIFSSGTAPKKNWWYYGFNHGQHISFYSVKTLRTIANMFDMKLYVFDGVYLMTKKNIYKLRYWEVKFLASYRILNQVLFKRLLTSKTQNDHLYLINQ